MLVQAKTHDVDDLARNMAVWGSRARSMPPSWRGAGVKHPVRGPGGETLGYILPGKGFASRFDLSRLGITKPIPNVIEPSLVHRVAEFFADDRGDITSYDGIIASRAGGKANDVAFMKISLTTVGSNYSALFTTGGHPAATGGTYTAIPGGAAMSNARTGALSFALSNPTGGDKKYLLTFGFVSASQINMLILADLLVGCGSINANLNTAQTINSTALTRYTSGAGVLMTFDVTTQLGGVSSNLNVSSYTNQGGTPSRATGNVAMTTSAIVGRLMPTQLGAWMILQGDDYGVQSVETLQFSAAMGAGVVALNLYYPLAFLPGVAGSVYVERDSTTQIDGITELAQTGGGALGCLVLYVLPNSTASGVLTGFMRTCAG